MTRHGTVGLPQPRPAHRRDAHDDRGARWQHHRRYRRDKRRGTCLSLIRTYWATPLARAKRRRSRHLAGRFTGSSSCRCARRCPSRLSPLAYPSTMRCWKKSAPFPRRARSIALATHQPRRPLDDRRENRHGTGEYCAARTRCIAVPRTKIVSEDDGEYLVVTTPLPAARQRAGCWPILDYPLTKLSQPIAVVVVPVLVVLALALLAAVGGAFWSYAVFRGHWRRWPARPGESPRAITLRRQSSQQRDEIGQLCGGADHT